LGDAGLIFIQFFWEWEIGDINPILGDAGLIFIQFFWEWEIGDINPIWGTRD
jgi:hypothetical protein